MRAFHYCSLEGKIRPARSRAFFITELKKTLLETLLLLFKDISLVPYIDIIIGGHGFFLRGGGGGGNFFDFDVKTRAQGAAGAEIALIST